MRRTTKAIMITILSHQQFCSYLCCCWCCCCIISFSLKTKTFIYTILPPFLLGGIFIVLSRRAHLRCWGTMAGDRYCRFIQSRKAKKNVATCFMASICAGLNVRRNLIDKTFHMSIIQIVTGVKARARRWGHHLMVIYDGHRISGDTHTHTRSRTAVKFRFGGNPCSLYGDRCCCDPASVVHPMATGEVKVIPKCASKQPPSKLESSTPGNSSCSQ